MNGIPILVYATLAFHPARGGYANAMTNFVTTLAGTGRFNIHVFTDEPLGEADEIVLPGVTVTRIARARRGRTVRQPMALARAIIKRYPKASRVLVETGEYPLLALMLQRRFGAQAVRMRLHACYDTEFLAWRGSLTDRINLAIIRRFHRNADVVVATNRHHLSFAAQHFLDGDLYRLARKRLIEIPNSVTPKVSGDLPADVRVPFFFSLGRMNVVDDVAQKGFDDLLDAFKLIASSWPQVQLVLCGDGLQRQTLASRAATLGLLERVLFVDRATEAQLGALIAQAAACVLPSRWEGYSMFAAEVAATGGLLIGSDHTGLSSVVQDGRSGLLVHPHDAQALARAMQTVLAMRRQDRQRLCDAAAKDIAAASAPDRLATLVELLWSTSQGASQTPSARIRS